MIDMNTKIIKRKDRKINIGAGRQFKLDLDRFLMFLVYYRLYITYTLLGLLFGFSITGTICIEIYKR